jgi:hypothetical protein
VRELISVWTVESTIVGDRIHFNSSRMWLFTCPTSTTFILRLYDSISVTRVDHAFLHESICFWRTGGCWVQRWWPFACQVTLAPSTAHSLDVGSNKEKCRSEINWIKIQLVMLKMFIGSDQYNREDHCCTWEWHVVTRHRHGQRQSASEGWE